MAFQILNQPECNIFSNVSPEGFKQIRQVCGVMLRPLGSWGPWETVSPTREEMPSLPVPEAPRSSQSPTRILGGRPCFHAFSKAK